MKISLLQEEFTGLKTGMKEFMKQIYESCFVSPWASSAEKESEH